MYENMKPKPNYNYKNEDRALKTRKKRLYKRIKQMLNINTFFLTFTFSDETLKRTNQETRKRLIKAFLNEQAKDYILNIDYGKENEREHYHAIANPKGKIFILNKYKYGFIKVKRVNNSKYARGQDTALNLTRHAIKETTKDNAIIFSRIQPKNSGFKYEKEETKLLKKWEQEEKERAELIEIMQERAKYDEIIEQRIEEKYKIN